MKLPRFGALVNSADEAVWAWEQPDFTRDFESIPPLITNPQSGQTESVAPPDALVVDLEGEVEPGDLPTLYGDMAGRNLRVRAVDGTWRFFRVLRAGDLGREVEHPIEALRRERGTRATTA